MSESNDDELVGEDSWDSDESDTGAADDGESADGEPEDSNADGDGERAEPAGQSENGGRRPRRRRRGRPREGGDDAPLPDDERARQALEFVTKLMVQMQMDCTVRARRPKPEEPAEIQLEISGRDSG